MRATLISFLIFFTVSALAQKVVVSGTVADIGNKALADVIVKITDGSKNYAFTTTDTKGAYNLTFDTKVTNGKSLVIEFNHISFEKESIALSQDKPALRHDIIMIPKSIELKEVRVKAEPLRQMGDTLKYNLASFIGKGDVTLEDGLKRLPGIEVSTSGAISYMGKGISDFYIEGLDMLGGRYNLATKNIPAQYATQIEILRHHKARKVDADEESNDVAINVKLSRKAKFKPFGQPELGVGYRDDDILVTLGLTGMMFADGYQLLASGKFSNDGNYGYYDIIDHFYSNSGEDLAPDLLHGWSGGVPPIGDYLHERAGYGSLNSISKLGEDRTFRFNADYSYQRNHNEYLTQTLYFADGQNVGISETQNPFSRIHKPVAAIRYVNNTAIHYVLEELKVKTTIEENENPVMSNAVLNDQHRRSNSLMVSNRFNSTFKRGTTKYYLNSYVDFRRAPEVTLRMNNVEQHGQSTSLKSDHHASFTLNTDGKWTVALPIGIIADYDFLETVLTGTQDMDNVQRIRGWKVEPQACPTTSWNSSDKKAHASFGVDVRWNTMHYKTSGGSDTDFSKLLIDPYLSLRYTISGNSEISLTSTLRQKTGDMLDLLTAPVQTDYRNTVMSSGIIGETEMWTSVINYKFQMPFSYFAMTANASWNQGKRNVLSSQMVDNGSVSVGSIIRDSYSRSASANLKFSKNYIPINTKLEADFSGRWGSSETMSQLNPLTTYSQGYSISGKATVSPVHWTEITGRVTYDKSCTRYNGIHNDYDDLSAKGSLAVYPTKPLEIMASYDYVHSQISESQHKDASLLNASVQYKARRSTWKLSLNNLLDSKHYSYTTYSGPDRYVFDCSLLGRTAMLTCTINLVNSK